LAIQQDHGIAVALSTCAQAFDHHKREVHDSNIEAGAIISLLHALDHVTRKIKVSQSPLGSTNEAKTLMIAAAAGISGLEMIITRCSSEALEQCVRRNSNDLFPSLTSLLTIFSAGDNQSSVVRHLLLKNTLNSLNAVSRVSLAEIEIDLAAIKYCCTALIATLQCESPGLVRSNCVSVLANLSRTDKFRHAMSTSTGLLDTLVVLIRPDDRRVVDTVCENALQAIYNLCDCTEGKASAIICSDSNVSSLLLGILSGTIEASDVAYAYCVRAIKCLASHPPNQKHLAKYRSIVPTLIALAAKGPCSPGTKEAAIEAIVLLSRTAILI
jgi:hypothetical protein